MTDLTTLTTLASEFALDTWVGAISLVVADLATVEALSRQTAATFSTRLGAVTSEMSVLAAAAK